MNAVYFDRQVDDGVRRRSLYEGQLFAYSARPAMRALCQHAQRMIEEAFGSLDPRVAQFDMPVEQYVAIVAPLKPKFIHDPRTMGLLQNVLAEFSCDPQTTYIDVPRLRMVTHGGYLTSGVGYAHHPHRDTWYSAPFTQLNWWVPIYDVESESSMAFHPAYWSQAVANSSDEFNYYEWNSVGRKNAAQFIGTDTRNQPKPKEAVRLDPQIRLLTEPAGTVIFSAAQLHSTVPNTSGRTRYSIDFRTVNIADIEAGLARRTSTRGVPAHRCAISEDAAICPPCPRISSAVTTAAGLKTGCWSTHRWRWGRHDDHQSQYRGDHEHHHGRPPLSHLSVGRHDRVLQHAKCAGAQCSPPGDP